MWLSLISPSVIVKLNDKRQTCRMALYLRFHHHQIVSFRLLASITSERKENKENRRRVKLLLIDLFSCTFAWFKFRVFSVRWKLLMRFAILRLKFFETTCQLWLLISRSLIRWWLSAFPCNCCALSSRLRIIFPWISLQAVSKIFPDWSADRFSETRFLVKCISARHLIAFWGKNNEFVSIVEFAWGERRDRSMSVIIQCPKSESERKMCVDALLILFVC